VKIEVTEDDIERGKPISASQCPIALACRRTFDKGVTVTLQSGIHVYYFNDDRIDLYSRDCPKFTKTYSITASVTKFIRDFDHGLEVKPFTFETEEVITND
jgi:hypothetical protein